jgi:flagella basal body P-ring formation protein FlgA
MRALSLAAGIALIAAAPVAADTLLAARTLRAGTVVDPADVVRRDVQLSGAIARMEDIVGLETRVAVYAGRPFRPGDLGPPAIVERNQVLRLSYAAHGLQITTEGRALARGGVGDLIRVMNLSSRTTVSGVVLSDGSVRIER